MQQLKKIGTALRDALMPVRQLRRWAEDRLEQAMTCPECGHGGVALDTADRAEQAAECSCGDPLCLCNDEGIQNGGDPW